MKVMTERQKEASIRIDLAKSNIDDCKELIAMAIDGGKYDLAKAKIDDLERYERDLEEARCIAKFGRLVF